jgi:MiaB-like tRNA modifying enzyme
LKSTKNGFYTENLEVIMSEETSKSTIVLNFGCSANRAISEGISGILLSSGYGVTDSIKDADIIIVNTCVVKQNTEHRMKSLLLSLPADRQIVVTGCLPVVMQDWIDRYVPHVKTIFPENTYEIISLLKNESITNSRIMNTDIWERLYSKDRVLFNPLITTIEIARGCLGQCAYCIVKQAKGHLRSRTKSSIVNEAKRALKNGSKEIWLTSQDTGVYGWDFQPKQYLPDLINSLTSLEGQYYLRLGMMTPSTVNRFVRPLINQVNHSKVYSFLHLPIQSGSNRMLKRMKRKETREEFINLVNRLKENVPHLVISTDIIVGFPGETEGDYHQTETLIKETRPVIVNISKYTDRSGTSAAKMDRKISTKIKSTRSKKLTKLCRNISRKELKSWIGWTGSILIEDVGKHVNQFKARTSSYLPVVINNSGIDLGSFYTTTIIDATANYLIGEIKN